MTKDISENIDRAGPAGQGQSWVSRGGQIPGFIVPGTEDGLARGAAVPVRKVSNGAGSRGRDGFE